MPKAKMPKGTPPNGMPKGMHRMGDGSMMKDSDMPMIGKGGGKKPKVKKGTKRGY